MKKGMRMTALLICAGLLLCTSACEKSEGHPESGASASSGTAPGIAGVNADNYPRVDGSTANLPLMAALYSRACGVSPEEAETMVQASGGTGAAWKNFFWESTEHPSLLLVYEAPESVKDNFYKEMAACEITPAGRDGLVFMVNAENPVDSLTREQLIDIYTGEITDWEEVGGTPGPIAPFQRNPESGSQTLFLKLLMKETAPMKPPSTLVPADMGSLIDGVAEYDGEGGSLGYSVYYYAKEMYANPGLKLLKVDGVEPSAEAIGNGTYPLVNDFYAVIRKDEPEHSTARLLYNWILSDEGRELMTEAGYVPAEKAE